MGQTRAQLFPGVPRQAIRAYFRSASFSAALVAPGVFDFDSTVSIGTLPHDVRGVIAGVDFAANIDQLDFSDALDPTFQGGFFRLDLIRGGEGHQVNDSPFLFSAFGQGAGFMTEYSPTATTGQEEEMFLRLRGRIIQTPRILATGKTSITITAALNQYNIKGGYNV